MSPFLDIVLITLPDHNDPNSIWRGTYIFIILTISIIIVCIWAYIRKIQKVDRISQIKKCIARFSYSDPFWNEKEMRKLGKDVFRLVMNAWSNGDSRKVSPLLTEKLKNEWKEIWANMKADGYTFIYSQIFIQEVNIITAQDFKDNSKDTFTVEISGYVKRFLVHTESNKIIPKHGDELEDFIDLYTFVRTNQGWLLNEILPRAKFKDIFKVPTN